jgi:hypothetical protein
MRSGMSGKNLLGTWAHTLYIPVGSFVGTRVQQVHVGDNKYPRLLVPGRVREFLLLIAHTTFCRRVWVENRNGHNQSAIQIIPESLDFAA